MDVKGAAFHTYQGDASMFQVHKYMQLDQYEMGYFIEQVALSAASFGVTDEDVLTVAGALMQYFGYQCQPPFAFKNGKIAKQSICT